MSCAGGRVFLFGGQDVNGGVHNDLHVLSDMNTMSTAWSQPLPSGNLPTPRKSHSLTHGRGTTVVRCTAYNDE